MNQQNTPEASTGSVDNEILLKVFKGVSLLDLTECEFEYGDEEGKWINAIYEGRVIDSIKWDGNIFWMMNNDGSFSPLNPMSSAFSIAGAKWAGQATEKGILYKKIIQVLNKLPLKEVSGDLFDRVSAAHEIETLFAATPVKREGEAKSKEEILHKHVKDIYLFTHGTLEKREQFTQAIYKAMEEYKQSNHD